LILCLPDDSDTAQAVCPRLLTAEARSSPPGICDSHRDTRAGWFVSKYLVLPCQQSTSTPHSLRILVIRGWYSGPQLHPTFIILYARGPTDTMMHCLFAAVDGLSVWWRHFLRWATRRCV